MLTFAHCVGKRDKYSDVRQTLRALDDVLSWAKAHHYLLIVDFLFSIRVAQGKAVHDINLYNSYFSSLVRSSLVVCRTFKSVNTQKS